MVEHQDSEHLTLRERWLPACTSPKGESFGQWVASKIGRHFLAEIVDEAKHFYYFGSIYHKTHKARGLGETSDNISTDPLAFLFYLKAPFYSS